MIVAQDYDDMLRNLGREYFITDIRYVADLNAWAKQNNVGLDEPAQPMKLITTRGDQLAMVIQSEIDESVLDSMITGLDVRWQVVDNRANLLFQFDTVEKKLAYAFLKEYARTKRNLVEDERLEDEWVIHQMERLGLLMYAHKEPL
ncbi:MAG: hypothetical protein AB1553_11865 [Nitrospirota bacterium]